jgi:hypothetical protein
MGGWGSKCSGGNPGCYRDAHFAQAFPAPNYLTIGCNNKLVLTSSAAVMKVIPASGTPAVLPAGTMTDPKRYDNTFAGQLVAATLSTKFDLIDPNFSSSSIHLEDLIVGSGLFAGWTVKQVIAEANRKIGGCSSLYTPSQLTDVLNSINSNYTDGTINSGFLNCPSGSRLAFTEADGGGIVSSAYPNPFSSSTTIEFTTASASEKTLIEVYSVSGEKVATLYNGPTEAGIRYQAEFNGSVLAEGIYIYRIIYGENLVNGKLILIHK